VFHAPGASPAPGALPLASASVPLCHSFDRTRRHKSPPLPLPDVQPNEEEDDAMKTIEKLAPWITVLEGSLEVTLFAAASAVVTWGIFVLLLRPTMVLA